MKIKVSEKGNKVIIKGAGGFNLRHTLDCGQVFRFTETPAGSFIVVAGSRVIELCQRGDEIVIENSSIDEFYNVWENYFDLRRDYKKIQALVNKDDIINTASRYGDGIRILAQEPFECLISFIISQRNAIPNIKRVIERICEKYGEVIGEYKGKIYHAFPTPEQLNRAKIEDLNALKCGYRSEYIINAANRVHSGEADLAKLYSMDSAGQKSTLMEFRGVGQKIAECVMLFAYSNFDVFPPDTWIIKAMNDFYNVPQNNIDEFSASYFGGYRGLAQQYLFFYRRNFKENGE